MAAVAGRREHEPFMLDGAAHLSTTSEGELRMVVSDSQRLNRLRIPEQKLSIILGMNGSS